MNGAHRYYVASIPAAFPLAFPPFSLFVAIHLHRGLLRSPQRTDRPFEASQEEMAAIELREW